MAVYENIHFYHLLFLPANYLWNCALSLSSLARQLHALERLLG